MTLALDSHGQDCLDLLDALVYGDVFDCALTLDELRRYGRVPIARDELARRLREDPELRGLVVERDGLYAFADRPELIAARPERMRRAWTLQRRARRVAWVLRHVPFVRGLALTGSAAAEDAGDGADVDVLVVVTPGRLGLMFLLLGSASRVLGRRVFCPNYYVCADQLEIGPRTVYIARELAQARPLAGDAEGLRTANPWVADVFPNASSSLAADALSVGGRLQRLLEAPLRGGLGDRLEGRAGSVAAGRLRAHYASFGRDVPTQTLSEFEAGRALRFHGLRHGQTTRERYVARRAELAERLALGRTPA
jgi:predicted nucleotidyltransferase